MGSVNKCNHVARKTKSVDEKLSLTNMHRYDNDGGGRGRCGITSWHQQKRRCNDDAEVGGWSRGPLYAIWTHSIGNLASGSLKLLGSKIKSTNNNRFRREIKTTEMYCNIYCFLSNHFYYFASFALPRNLGSSTCS